MPKPISRVESLGVAHSMQHIQALTGMPLALVKSMKEAVKKRIKKQNKHHPKRKMVFVFDVVALVIIRLIVMLEHTKMDMSWIKTNHRKSLLKPKLSIWNIHNQKWIFYLLSLELL